MHAHEPHRVRRGWAPQLLVGLVFAAGLGAARAEVVGGPVFGGCDIENNYGRSMALLDDGRLAVGSPGEFCGWVDVLDATGASVASLRDTEDTSFGRVVGAIGRDVLAGSGVSGRVLRVETDTAAIHAVYELPDGLPDAIAAVGRYVAVLVRRDPAPQVVYVFEARSGALRRTIPNPDSTYDLYPLLVRVGRWLAIADRGGTVRLLDPNSGRARVRVRGGPLGGAIAADGELMAVLVLGPGGNAVVQVRDRRGRLLRAIEPPGGADCFGFALALLDDVLLVGAPCTNVLDWSEGTGYLYGARSGSLLARFEGYGTNEQLGSSVALLPGAAALGGRGPDTADNGIVRVFPR